MYWDSFSCVWLREFCRIALVDIGVEKADPDETADAKLMRGDYGSESLLTLKICWFEDVRT